ncbi:alpha-catulin isoform X1 [Octopus bimaculoides]|nr:alpha-catulin isoform X1 [Octopus bimaculoides]
MAGLAQPKSESKLPLEIRTKSVEHTLVPLVAQITTLVNHKEKTKVSEKTLRVLVQVGQVVNRAVGKFVSVGESIAEENPEIKNEMCEACQEARQAGVSIQKLTATPDGNSGQSKTIKEKTAMVRAARQLLSAITRVLLLADKVVVKQLLAAKDRVLASLVKLERVSNFTDFMDAFSHFGKEMVCLAQITGERQNDLKSDKQRAQMGAARAVLEKATMMLLTSSKTCLRHPDCHSAKQNRAGVFAQMRRALDMVHQIVTNGGMSSDSLSPTVNGDSGIGLATSQPTASRVLKDFDDLCELTRITMVGPSTQEKLNSALDLIIESSQDFTDSAYTSHENRERILDLCDQLRIQLNNLIKIGASLDQKENASSSQELETAILKTIEASKVLHKQLQDTTMDQASELFKVNEDHDLLKGLKIHGLAGSPDKVDELSVKFREHSEQLEEVCKLLRHIANTGPLIITAEHNESVIHVTCPLLLNAAQTFAQYPGSRIAEGNLDVFAKAWEGQINELSILVKEVNDVCQGKMEKHVYQSLPRPGKHGTMVKSLRPVKLDAEEQAKIAKLGLEMKLITSEMDAETDKWEEADNDIVKRAKNMSSMAFSMYLFTRGEGPLKTTQDLFTQAKYFADEGNKLYKTVKEFAERVPASGHKEELVVHLDRIPVFCQQLLKTLRAPTFGKAATFNKVDSAIQETKNLMNAVAKVVTTSFICATKYNIDCRSTSVQSYKWRGSSQRLDNQANGGTDAGSESGGSSTTTTAPPSLQNSYIEGLYRSSSLNKPLSTIGLLDS